MQYLTDAIEIAVGKRLLGRFHLPAPTVAIRRRVSESDTESAQLSDSSSVLWYSGSTVKHPSTGQTTAATGR